jgi:hypothetical protein
MNCACLLLLALLNFAPRETVWNFNDDEEGKKPDGFYFDATKKAPDGKWQVLRDGEDRVLAQVDRNTTRDRFALAVVDDSSLEHLRLSVRIKAVDGNSDQTGGLVWRYRNSENYLVARLDVLEDNVQLYRVVNGNRVRFGDKQRVKLVKNQWYTLRVEHVGDTIKVYLDDDALIVEKDRHFKRAGKIGLWTKADSLTYFDDLRVRKLDDDD